MSSQDLTESSSENVSSEDFSNLLGSIGTELLDSLPLLVAYCDSDLVYRFCNRFYETWFDIPRSEVIDKKRVPDLVGEAAFAEIQPYIDRVFGGESCGYEKHLEFKSGLSGWFRTHYTPHFGNDNEVIGYFVAVENITEKREAESQLLGRERKLQFALDAGEFGTWVVNINERIAELDTTLADIIGLPPKEYHLPLDLFVELVAEEDRERIATSVQRTLEEHVDFSEQYRMHRPQGGQVWLSSYGKIHRDPQGVADRVIGVSHDITELKEAEEQLRRLNDDLKSRAERDAEALLMTEANLQAIVNTAADAILTVNDQRIILSANPSADLMFGVGSGDPGLIGRSLDELLNTEAVSLDLAILDGESEFAATNRTISRNILAHQIDGHEFSAELSLARAKNLPFSVVLLRDISERREFEGAALRAAEDEKERIARDLHDGLGSMLGGVTCLAKSLEKDLTVSDHPGAAQAAQIGSTLQKSVALTRQLSHGLNAVGASPEALTEALREFAQMTGTNPDISCVLICPEPVDIASRVTANHLFRIAQEAVNNAVRHSHCDAITIELHRWPDTVVLSVTDNGNSGAGDDAANNNDRNKRREGFGQRTMRYRAREMHGHLDIAATDSGTSVICRVPIHQA